MIIQQNHIKNTGRKVIVLSAFFLFLLGACKKPESKVGAEVYDPNELLDAKGVDTFQLRTYSKVEDSSITSAQAVVLLGSYNDPVFGEVDASFFAQFRLESNAPDFGDMSQTIIDSMVMSLNFASNYGAIDAAQNYEVYALAQDISADSIYYAHSSFDTLPGSLIPAGKNLIKLIPDAPTYIVGDTLETQLRLNLDTNYARSIMSAGSSVLTDNTSFLASFKGFLVKTNNGSWSSGKGSVLSLDAYDPDTKITIYYRQGGISKQYHLLLNDVAAHFNRVKFNNAGSAVKAVLNDSTKGMESFYAQANFIKGKIEFPTISSLNKKTVIHRATLYLPVSYYDGGAFYPSAEVLTVTVFTSLGQIGVASGTYDASTKQYILNVTNYIQALVGGNYENTGIYLYPKNFGNSVERIVLNGKKTPNKTKPRLIITYTQF